MSIKQNTWYSNNSEDLPAEKIDQFKYVNICISKDGEINEEINVCIGAAGNTFWVMDTKFFRKQEVYEKTNMRIFKIVTSLPIAVNSGSLVLASTIISKYRK